MDSQDRSNWRIKNSWSNWSNNRDKRDQDLQNIFKELADEEKKPDEVAEASNNLLLTRRQAILGAGLAGLAAVTAGILATEVVKDNFGDGKQGSSDGSREMSEEDRIIEEIKQNPDILRYRYGFSYDLCNKLSLYMDLQDERVLEEVVYGIISEKITSLAKEATRTTREEALTTIKGDEEEMGVLTYVGGVNTYYPEYVNSSLEGKVEYCTDYDNTIEIPIYSKDNTESTKVAVNAMEAVDNSDYENALDSALRFAIRDDLCVRFDPSNNLFTFEDDRSKDKSNEPKPRDGGLEL